MSAAATSTPGYDEHYRSGGFGADAQREHWEAWAGRHYVQAFDLRPGERVLDIPSGDGFWSAVLERLGFEVVGVDLSIGGVETARKRYPGIAFHVGNAEEALPVPQEGFDIVFSRGISHLHRSQLFTDGAERMAQNLMRYVARGGFLLVSYSTHRTGRGSEGHFHHLVADLVRLFEKAGDIFKVEVVDNFVQIGVRRRDAPRKWPRPPPRKKRWSRRLRIGLARAVRRVIPRRS